MAERGRTSRKIPAISGSRNVRVTVVAPIPECLPGVGEHSPNVSMLPRTGDVLLYSGNTPTGFLLRTFTSSKWNHAGIAVRLMQQDGTPKASITEEGKLHVLEINTGHRVDGLTGEGCRGVGFSDASWSFRPFNVVALRQLREHLRTPELAERTLEFARNNRGREFPTGFLPFIAIWLGIPLSDSDTSMFCSEFMAHYYLHCFSGPYRMDHGVDPSVGDLLGDPTVSAESVVNPENYSYRHGRSYIFLDEQREIYTAEADILYLMLQPLLVGLLMVVVIMYSLRR